MRAARGIVLVAALAATLVLAAPASAETIRVTTERETGRGSLGNAIGTFLGFMAAGLT